MYKLKYMKHQTDWELLKKKKTVIILFLKDMQDFCLYYFVALPIAMFLM